MTETLKRHWPAIVLLALVLAGFPRLFTRTDYAPGDDVLEYAGPFATHTLRALAAGDSPAWIPNIETGTPLWSFAPWMGPFYPLSVLYALLPLPWAFNAGYLFHILLAAAGCYLLARALSLSRAGAAASAAALVLSSEFVYRLNQGYLPDTVSVAYLPWLLLCAERICRSPREAVRYAALAALCAGLTLLGGHTTHDWMVLFTFALYGVVRALVIGRGAEGTGRATAVFAICAAVLAGVLAAAVQTFPLIQTMIGSPAGHGREFRPWAEFINQWWRVFQWPFVGAAPNVRGAGFIGVGVTALALAGAWSWRRERARWPFAVVAAAGYIIFISPSVGLYDVLARLIPTFGILSYTYLFLYPCILVACLCAGRGLDEYTARSPGIGDAVAGGAAVAGLLGWGAWYAKAFVNPATGPAADAAWLFVPFFAAVVAVAAALAARRAGVLTGAAFSAAFIALIAVEALVYVWHATDPVTPPFVPERYYDGTPLTDIMKSRVRPGDRFRFWDLEVKRPEGRRFVKRHQAVMDGLDEVSLTSKLPRARLIEYSRLFGGRLTLDQLTQLVRAAEGRVGDGTIDLEREGAGAARLLHMLGVRFIVSDLPIVGGGYAPVVTRDGVSLYETAYSLPRAFVAHDVAAARDGREALAVISSPAFDPQRTALIEGGAPPPGGGGTAEITSYRNAEVRVKAGAPNGGVLVLLDPWDRSWRAAVAGRPVPVLRADYLFRAVQVPAGVSEVVFTYVPVPYLVGRVVTPLLVAALVLVFFAMRRPGRRPDKECA